MIFYNSLSRKKEVFKPIDKKLITLYTCGPTVYDSPHIGNYRTFLFEDLLKRTLIASGFKVEHAMNITDIDDKTIKASTNENIDLKEFTKKYINIFFDELKMLRILPADYYPRATKYISEMINIIENLISKNHAYISSSGDVYFSIESFQKYGTLTNLKLDKLIQSKRVLSDEYSSDTIQDFALWKAYKPSDGNVYWQSPWGKGRPGWHIECSAMAMNLLGNSIDIHCGGVDNKFPHHENEIAQSECFSQSKFVNYWLHSDFLLVDGEKMSKSKGNFYTLNDIIKKGMSVEEFRYMIFSAHYRSKINFSLKRINNAKKAISRITNLKHKLIPIAKDKIQAFPNAKERFHEALKDDLDSPKAFSIFFEWLKDINSMIDNGTISEIEVAKSINFINFFDYIFQVIPKNQEIPERIINYAKLREIARMKKDWTEADKLRNKIDYYGWVVEDSKEGFRLKKKL
ncbi:cysteine--tRNA ligase [bacterium]|nr:MAG: cysteine--tRNA ligase [bacterium]